MHPGGETVASSRQHFHGLRTAPSQERTKTKASETALVLIGFQNDYFGKDGILRGVIEESAKTNHVLENTLRLLDQLSPTDTLLLETPILFTNDYSETNKPVGLLKAIAELKAFQEGSPGADSLPELKSYGDRILTVPGKDGFNAFSHTGLARVFEEKSIRNVVLARATPFPRCHSPHLWRVLGQGRGDSDGQASGQPRHSFCNWSGGGAHRAAELAHPRPSSDKTWNAPRSP